MSRLGRITLGAAVAMIVGLLWYAPAPRASGGVGSIQAADLKAWLTYIASDDLQGRSVFSEGLGLAASYIESHLHEWGTKPFGEHGTYLQTVPVLGLRATSRSTVTVDVGGEIRTFADGRGVTFPRNAGGKRRLTIEHVEFAGYGLDLPALHHADYADKNVKGA